MKKSLVISALLAITMLFALFAFPASAKSGSALDLVMSVSENGDNEFTVTISVENISETLHVVEYALEYDSSKLELTNSTDDEGALECISRLPENWENFASKQSDGLVGVLALTAAIPGISDGELQFEFNFRVKEGASGKATVSVPAESVLGATVGDADIDEYGGKGGSVVVTLSDEGSVGDVSTSTEDAPESGAQSGESNGDAVSETQPSESKGDSASQENSSGDESDGEQQSENGISGWVIAAVVAGVAVVAAAVTVLVVKKRKA